ncbi:hypothetical protein ACJMK2_003760 [Sinanodonta woodiana]|uniref:Testicular haploid expressed protein n=1 Tax=Sinanodonta woodiana TaxID=1069815 RepID=A0ABD3XZ68_SINWO
MATDVVSTSSSTQISRLEQLAKPKPIPPGFLEDRRSVYWIDYVPPQPGESGTTEITASARVQELSRHRPPHSAWKGDRITPIWPVSDSAKNATPTERIIALCEQKKIYAFLDRSPYTEVSLGARSATASSRLEMLAKPKIKEDRFGIKETQWGQYIPVPDTAMKARATERIESLAQYKPYHKEFKNERPVQWPISESALKVLPTMRLQQLSRPRSRTMIKDDYDPYKVTFAARKARPTPRLEELCVPLPRKVRPKKIV